MEHRIVENVNIRTRRWETNLVGPSAAHSLVCGTYLGACSHGPNRRHLFLPVRIVGIACQSNSDSGRRAIITLST